MSKLSNLVNLDNMCVHHSNPIKHWNLYRLFLKNGFSEDAIKWIRHYDGDDPWGDCPCLDWLVKATGLGFPGCPLRLFWDMCDPGRRCEFRLRKGKNTQNDEKGVYWIARSPHTKNFKERMLMKPSFIWTKEPTQLICVYFLPRGVYEILGCTPNGESYRHIFNITTTNHSTQKHHCPELELKLWGKTTNLKDNEPENRES